MGIRDRPISPRSPWQNGYAERLIGTVRPPTDNLRYETIAIFDEHLGEMVRDIERYLGSVFDFSSRQFQS